MVSGLYSARNGMMLLQDMVDNTTNNLTNANTTGFKKSLMVSMSEVKTQRNDQALLVHSDKQWMGERVTDWEQGSLVETGNSMDVALEGNGFMKVETPDGVRYTRSGSLTRNGMGEVTTLQGFKVLDETDNPIVVEGSRFSVGSSGEVSSDKGVAGKIGVVDFEDRKQLKSEDRNVWNVEDADQANAQPATGFRMRQGFVEASNVNIVESMVDLIRFQRNYELDQKAVQSEDETLQKAVNEIGRV